MGLPFISSRATWWEHRAELSAESPGLLRGAGAGASECTRWGQAWGCEEPGEQRQVHLPVGGQTLF